MIEIFEGIYQENIKISPFRKFIEKLFALTQKYKEEYNDLLQGLVKSVINSLYGVQIRKDINQYYKCKSQHWMETEYDDKILAYWRLPNGKYFVKLKIDDGLGNENNVKKHCQTILELFLSNRKRILNNFN